MNNFKKVVNPGRVLNWSGKRRINMFCEIEFKDGKLSITGVVGPRPSGNCDGGCGQVTDDLKRIVVLGPGWSRPMVNKFHNVWDKWHLNDMRANCEHQVGPEWDSHKITITKYKLSDNSKLVLKNRLEKSVGENVYDLSKREALAHLADDHETDAIRLLQAYDLGLMSWSGVSLPDGIPNKFAALKVLVDSGDITLTKPCPVCGYKYGTAWLKEEVPDDVLEFLVSLPNTTITPAWV